MKKATIIETSSGAWAVSNNTGRADDAVLPLVQFAIDQVGHLQSNEYWLPTGFVNLRKRARHNYPSGHASDRKQHDDYPMYAGGARYCIMATDLALPFKWDGIPRVCFHSKEATRLYRHVYEFDAVTFGMHMQMLLDRGEDTLGRWPIFVTHGWEEALLHTLLHEMLHVLDYDRGIGSSPEVETELAARSLLGMWR